MLYFRLYIMHLNILGVSYIKGKDILYVKKNVRGLEEKGI